MREQLLAAEWIQAIEWRDDALYLLDQRQLPAQQVWLRHDTASAVADAIRSLMVRGAAAIGISAAYGVVLAARAHLSGGGDWRQALEVDFALLAESRPVAANLGWALQRMRERLLRLKDDGDVLAQLEAEAVAIHASDREANLTIAQLGMELIRKHQGNSQVLLTHGNAGALASGGFGTALGVIRAAHLEGLVEQVYVDETRPWLQGARLTAWELQGDGVPVVLNVDAAAAHLMKSKGITWVVVGADRITANGDVVSKIGTYQLAVNAMHHGLRFMVVAASSAIDMSVDSGEDVLLEERSSTDFLQAIGQSVLEGIAVSNPLFDVTPADLVDYLVTEKGVVDRPDEAKLAQLMCRKHLH